MTRITQGSLSQGTLQNLQRSLARTQDIQERLSTGRQLNRPSDSPTGTVTAMQSRSSLAAVRTQLRAADNAEGWLDSADSALQSASGIISRARELAVQGQSGSLSGAGREAVAREVEALRDALVDVANSSFGGRQIFSGTSDAATAYQPDGTYQGDGGRVTRGVAEGVQMPVNLTGPEAFGPAGASAFDALTALATDLRTDPTNAATNNLGAIDVAHERVLTGLAEVGARTNRLEGIRERATALAMNLDTRLSEVESVDLPETIMELQMQEVAYQAALSATSRVIQPSLMDFLR